MRIAIKTLGCKSNRYESNKVLEQFRGEHEVFELNEGASSFQRKYLGQEPDLYIVNTCTVTHVADRKSRQAVRSIKSANPNAKIVVFGCGATVSKEDYKKMEEVDAVVDKLEDVISIVEEFSKERGHRSVSSDFDSGMRTRAVIKIQDGCNNFCTYCIIPHARGREVSFESKKILEEVCEKEAAGFKEIVLCGIIMSNWEEDGMDLADLIEFLMANTSDVRFRMSSLEPQNFSDKFVKLFKSGRLCPHVHMSLQSGSDSVLKRMRRRYDVALFRNVCEKLKKAVPDIGLTTDVIVGFPGETDEEFEETYDFVKKIGFLKMHVFPYSKRKNTAAYYMRSQISEDVKKLRAEKLRKLSDRMGRDFKKKLLGREYEVLVEECFDGIGKGFTPNYIPVQFCSGDESLVNNIVKVKLESIADNGTVNAFIIPNFF
jgi:threonylcarbamoyladenosine tRNA methylthiotransferase MtaB